MNQTYEMKDLGYPRTPTTAEYHVTQADGSVYAVPVQVIADNRDEYYRDEEEDTIGFIRRGEIADDEIGEWAHSDMNWSDLAPYARKVSDAVPLTMADFEEAWRDANGIELVGDV